MASKTFIDRDPVAGLVDAEWANEVDALVHDVFAGAVSVSAAMAALSLVPGVDIQALNATLTSIAALGTAADRIAYTTGVDTWAETPLTAAARSILDDTTTGAMLTTLGAQAQDATLDDIAAGVGTEGQVLTSTGIGTAPTFQDANGLPIGMLVKNWTERTNTAAEAWTSITYLAGFGWIAVGITDGVDASLHTSTDGTTWTERSNPLLQALRGVAASATIAVAVGDSTGAADAYLISSTDGTTWTERINASFLSLYAVIWSDADSLFVAVGAATGGNSIYVITSTDGTTWTDRSTASSVGKTCNAVTYYDGLYLACGALDAGDTTIISSTDAITWTQRTSIVGSQIGYGVAGGNNVYVIVGASSMVLTSTNGTTGWSSNTGISSLTAGLTLNAIIFTNGLFVVGASNGAMFSSEDGVTWSQHYSESISVNAIAEGADSIIHVGAVSTDAECFQSLFF